MHTGTARRTARLMAPVVALLLTAAALPAQPENPADPPGVLVAYSLKNGKQLWTADTLPSFSITDVSDPMVVGRGSNCDSSGYRTVATSARNGKVGWSTRSNYDAVFLFGAETLATGANRSGIVVANDAREIRGLDAKSGARRWRIRFDQTPTVTVDAGVVLVTTTRGEFETGITGVVTAYDRRTGERIWEKKRRGSETPTANPGSKVAILSFNRFDGTTTGSVVVDAKTGKRLWTSPLASSSVSGDVVLLTTVRGDPDPRIEAHDARIGALLWQRDPPYYGSTPLGSRVAIGITPDSRLVVDARSGLELYSLPSIGLPASGGDTVAWADRTTLHLADAESGVDRWTVALPGSDTSQSSIAIGNDAVYLARSCTAMD